MPAPANRLYYGDNLHVLRKLVKDESVDLAYIDPPFNSKRNYNQIYNNLGIEDRAQAQAFTDTWVWDEIATDGFQQLLENHEGRFTPQSVELIKGLRNVLKEGNLLAYLVSMTLRVTEIYRVLKPTGSFYLHCDPTASHYLKLILDAVFCAQSGDFKNEIIWQRTSAHNDPSRYGRIHDLILFYTKTEDYIWNQQYDPPDEQFFKAHDFELDEEGKRYRKRDLTAPGHGNKSGQYEWNGLRPPKNRMWSYTKENMEALQTEGRIVYTRTGMPRMKIYETDLKGVPFQDVWARPELWLNSAATERLGYPTQKPLALLERIITASSNVGDTVLDAYCGCGTTVAMAHKLKRQWIGIDITYQSISLILKRLEDTFGPESLATISLDGIPKDMASATALANKKDDRVRKEFEKWAVLSYSNNRATINEKKGADQGVDGIGYLVSGKNESERIIFQVKSGNVGAKDIRDLRGTMEQERAALGIFITLRPSTKSMDTAAHAAGTYTHVAMGRNYNRIQIVTIKDMVEKGVRLEMPLVRDVVRSAARLAKETLQLKLDPTA